MPIALAIIVSSCGNTPEEQVKQFAADFATKVSKNQKDSLAAVWPDVAKADSLALTFNADSIVVEPTQTPGQYKVTFGDADMLVTLTEDGKMTVGETHGLFAWPAKSYDLAKNTGQWKEGLNDIEQAERMNDTLFVKYLNDKIAGEIIADLKSKVRVTKSTITNHDLDNLRATGIVVVSNQSNRQLEGNEYVVIARLYDVTGFFGTKEFLGNRKLTGKAIPANGQVTYSFSYSLGAWPVDPECSISINPNIENVMEGYQPTGKEYEEYLATKQDDTSAEASSVDQRVDLSMNGTISTISNVSFVMNGTRGVLEYVMDGNSVVSELRFGSLRPDGTLTVKSYTPEGKLKGTFNGKLTTTNGSKQYKGHFTNVKGGSTTFSFTE